MVLATVGLPTRVEEPEVEAVEGEEGAEVAEGEEQPEGAVEGEAAPEAPADTTEG
jgi:hypothetical protein